MKKKIAILGSTGSIGKSLLKIVKKNKKEFEIVLLSSNKNYKVLLKQIKIFNVKNVVITNIKSYKKFVKINKNNKIKIYNNFNDFKLIFKHKIDYVMSSITGIDGLKPTLNIIPFTKTLAVANKESIICGWNLIKKKIKKFKTIFVPVDSEHFSIWYALNNKKDTNIKKIYLTASGGPLNNLPISKFKSVKISQALKHPNWSMGKKISIDSATMMNKVFEIIEAKNIFDFSFDKLGILVHPKSYIHSIICFNNGMIEIIAHDTDMKIPIFNTLSMDLNKKFSLKKLDLAKLNNLDLKQINLKKFPLVNILKKIPQKTSLFETVIVSANDELVKLFLEKKINFNDIQKRLIQIVNNKKFYKYKRFQPKNINQIVDLNKQVKFHINSKSI
ncbi:1-deoxy-D-xylulose-5-phosphate reductoisomerase [Candidatus Pelagibacter sp. HIMB1509]|uniref:1-deoxy-D-xylulose-5-phosphate reductoisomerase n=1 Tax=Candidatus Pelagibacter sp. HIMB1509 TaxID=3413339 RepID=UPI003F850038